MATEVLYTRIPEQLMEQIRARAKAEERTMAATVSRMLAHALACPHKAVRDEY